MSHQPLAVLSSTFRGSQLRWTTVDNEACSIVRTSRRLDYPVSYEMPFCTDRPNLEHIFDPETLVLVVSKPPAQCWEN